MMQPTVALLFGGNSNEYEVSLLTAQAVWRHLLNAGVRVLPIGITRLGVWHLFQGSPSALTEGNWEASPALTPILLGAQGAFFTEGGRVYHPDVLFPAVHGQRSEDGRLQGLLDLWGVPYVGCGVESSVLCMNKCLSKRLVAAAGVPTLPWVEVTDPVAGVAQILTRLSAPIFIKPARSGSSLGAGRADTQEALGPLLEKALQTDTLALAEPFVAGRELEVAVLEEGGSLTVSAPGEVIPNAPFYDYDTKYKSALAALQIPAKLSSALTQTVREYAAEVFRVLGCRHLGRVDFFLVGDAIYFNEINTLPGFTSISMYPRLMEAAGIPPHELLSRLIQEAIG